VGAHEDVVALDTSPHDPIARRPVGSQSRQVGVIGGVQDGPDFS
jgi:hypothetical protein